VDAVTEELGIDPTLSYQKGDKYRNGVRSKSAWMYTSPTDESVHLDHQIEDLWQTFREKMDYIKGLKDENEVDIFMGYRSNCDHAGMQIAPDKLQIFNALEISVSLSIIIT
jgi:hypothetical protein